MYKVMLIDDEETITEGLRKVVDWRKYDCEVIACAFDAIEGTALIREHHPDIVFTDIKMPGIDGLAMLAGLKGEMPNMQITVLTGHRDFDYAKRAINLGVVRFLTKPSKMREIEESLCVMVKALNKCDDAQSAMYESEEQIIANNFIVETAMKYIESHYHEKLTLEIVAHNTYVSQWHLSKLFKKHKSKSFNDLLNSTRIKKSKELIKDPSLKIQDISIFIGFCDSAHFSRIFKKYEGVSPQTYRNSIRKE